MLYLVNNGIVYECVGFIKDEIMFFFGFKFIVEDRKVEIIDV